jgi:AraC-like DNA-binding protein
MRALKKTGLLYANYYECGCGWTTLQGRHAHSFIEVLVVINGSLDIDAGTGRVRANTGDVVYYKAGQAHCEQVPAGKQCRFFCFAFECGPCGPCGLITHDNTGRFLILSKWMHEDNSSCYLDKKPGVDSLLQSFICELVKAGCFQPEDPLTKVRTLLKTQVGKTHTLDSCARLAGMSKFHFVRQYKRAVGRSPMEDLQYLRIEAAVDLLLTTDLPMKAVAQQTGFCDQHYFSRVFNRLKGLSPGAFRSKVTVSGRSC